MSAKQRLVVAFLLPFLAIASAFVPFHQNMPQMGPKMAMGGGQPPFIPHEYVCSADVKRQCRSVLSSATELTFDANRANALMPELTFVKGDGKQDDGGVPLMPFDGTDVSGDNAAPDPLRLASFMLTHVDVGRRGKTSLDVSGVLGVAVSRNGTGPVMGPYVSPEHKVWPGSTELKILFEGVYTENGDGESVLCMVGDALLPKRGSDAGNPWDWAKNTGRDSFQPPLTKDENIMLVLRYPTTLTLTTRDSSCLSRYSAALYRRPSVHAVSSYLVSALRRYESLHRRCGPGTPAYARAVELLRANFSAATSPSSAASGS